MKLRVILRHVFQDRPLRESDAGDQVVAILRERPQRRPHWRRMPRFDVAQEDREILFRAQYAGVGGGVERAVVLAADVEDDADFLLFGVGFSDEIARGAPGGQQRAKDRQNQGDYFHKLIRSLSDHCGSLSKSSGNRLIASRNVGSLCRLSKIASRLPARGFKLPSVCLRKPASTSPCVCRKRIQAGTSSDVAATLCG